MNIFHQHTTAVATVCVIGCCVIFLVLNSNFSIEVVLYDAGGGAVASWLVRSTSHGMVQVRALAGNIVLCSWATHFTVTVSLSTQVYKWGPANLMLG